MSAVVPRLEMRQGQSLVMTQQLQQSIKLLQLSSLELAEYVEQELEKNPLLEAEEESPEAEKEPSDEATPAADGEPVSAKAADDPNAGSDANEDAQADRYDNVGEDYATPRSRDHSMGDDDAPGLDAIPDHATSLREHLQRQLRMEISDPVKLLVGQHLIDLMDESGYIKDDLSAVAELLGCDASLIDEVFAVLHTFDPPGVCARSLQECLAIQLRDRDRFDPAMEKLLQNLDKVARGDITVLSRICGVDTDDIREMCAEIRALNPRPGMGYQHEPVQAVTPDVFVRPAKGGGWHIELNAGILPRLLVNRRYYAQLSGRTRDKEERKYLTEQLATANWLVKALDQRAQTILKVTTEIVAHQDMFFREGIRYLRPLTLKEVAAAVELHESTVSRVTTAKFMNTPRGTFELKYFFNAALQNSDGGEDYSNKAVQYLIREVIDREAPDHILSDDAIAVELQSRGIEIARRTVAKYRELQRLPSSSARKREKRGER